MPLFLMENTVQPYAWGSTTAIPQLMGIPNPDQRPMAELWMGAHPKSPSALRTDRGPVSLLTQIDSEPELFLGAKCVGKFGPRLPFLFKVLAAEKGLSIQSHPSKRQAEEGYAREDREGVPRDAPNRNYRDDNHKPELICALTDFVGLRGFRSPSTIAEDFESLAVDELAESTKILRSPASETDRLRDWFGRLMRAEPRVQRKAVDAAVHAARTADADRFKWILALARDFPGDVGILAPLYLNTVHLAPGEAMYLQAGVLHAYLHGTGVEIMANSDNVLRCGCTDKHIDVIELLRTVQFLAETPTPLRPRATPEEAPFRTYDTPVIEFSLSVADFPSDRPGTVSVPAGGAPSIFLAVVGSFQLREADSGDVVALASGHSCFVTGATVGSIQIRGNGTLFRATVQG